ncbi:MAG: hypothetical protein M3Q45_03965 [Chloroflexota bacterium]|nr:hypothetical protein [Chloroflexota bacterium]
MPSQQQVAVAREHFKRNVVRAQLSDLYGLMTGTETELLSFEEVAKRLRARQQIERGTQMVRLDRIVGSVGRYRDFTRTFLPRPGASQERWTRLDAALNALESVPPVELFKIGEVYFVRDGNHRVSVARANDASHIEAYVTEVKTDVPLTLDDFERDQWLIKAECADFMNLTHLDKLRPDHDLKLTEPGRYAMLVDHIEVHRYLRNLDLTRDGSEERLSWAAAVLSWYDHVYMSVVEAIRQYGLLEHFPNRTEADLYLWIVLHRERLAQEYELAPLDADTAVATFAEVYSGKPLERTLKGLRQGLHKLTLDQKPLGMTNEEFDVGRARHAAGEISIAEANERQVQAA